MISAQGVAVDETKVRPVKEWPTPCSITALRGFLGLAGFYWQFIQKLWYNWWTTNKFTMQTLFCLVLRSRGCIWDSKEWRMFSPGPPITRFCNPICRGMWCLPQWYWCSDSPRWASNSFLQQKDSGPSYEARSIWTRIDLIISRNKTLEALSLGGELFSFRPITIAWYIYSNNA